MKKLRVRDFDMAYVDRGDGQVLLLVHGFPLSHAMWRFQLDALSDSFRVIAPDLRSFGESRVDFPDAQSACITMESHADDLAALVDALGIKEPIAFCGLSMGGYVAWQFWRRHPDRVGKLILCDTRSAADDDAARQKRYDLAQRVLESGSQIAADAMLPRLFWKEAVRQDSPTARETRQVMCDTPPAAVAAALRGMAVRSDAADLLPTIDVPTLVFCGEHDEISPAEEMRSFAAKIPGATYVKIRDAGHMSPLENPAAVNDAIRAFLE
jgi:pimeloyl-ACP methyl ester carboxylesterase